MLFLAVLATAEADALRCDPTDNDIIEARRVIRHVQHMETRISEALRQQTGQLSGYIAQAMAAEIRALEGHARARAQTAREEAEARAAMAHEPSVAGCRVITGIAGLEPAGDVARQVAAGTLATETARLAGDAGAIGHAAGNDATLRFRHIRDSYPDFGDIRFDSLFGADDLADAPSRATALDYARHLTAPVAEAPPPVGALVSPGDHRRYLQRRSRDARAGLAAAWMTRALADRVPAVELSRWAEAVAPGSAGSGTAISARTLRRLLAVERFDAGYLTGLNALGTEELLREIVRNQTLDLRLAASRHDLAEHHGAIAAAILAILNEDSRFRPVATPAAAEVR